LGPAKPTGVRIFSSKISYSVKANQQLDQSIRSRIIALAFSMAAENERDLISQRTREVLCFKKAQGLKLGRLWGPGQSKLDAVRPEIERLGQFPRPGS